MFKKRVEFKGSAVVGGKDMKKLKKDAASSMGIRCVPVPGHWQDIGPRAPRPGHTTVQCKRIKPRTGVQSRC
jgi:hypothetical protein